MGNNKETSQMAVEAIISRETGRGMVNVLDNEKPVAQFELEQAEKMAFGLMCAAAVADMEQHLIWFLIKHVGMSRDDALSFLRRFRVFRADQPGISGGLYNDGKGEPERKM